ncbi:MAG: sigma-70 family RNA polymerase sigma factor [Thermodesulfobacteriota bacterium]
MISSTRPGPARLGHTVTAKTTGMQPMQGFQNSLHSFDQGDGPRGDVAQSGRPGLAAQKDPLGARLAASAQRLLDENPCRDLGNGLLHPLRSYQLPVFGNFSTYLMDIATRPDHAFVSPYCRIVLPPRTGKTVVAGNIIGRTGLHSVFVVPTKTLVHQISAELRSQIPGLPIGFYYGERKDPVENGINMVTYSTLQRHAKTGRLPKAIRDSALVFLDEAHHAMTHLRMKALQTAFHERAIRIALTATPDYDDHRRLLQFFPDLVHEMELSEALVLGLLAPARMWVVEVDADASKVRLVAGDYEQETLGRLMSSSPFFKAVEMFRYSDANRKMAGIVTCASREQACDLWKYLKKHRPAGRPLPGLILGETPKRKRERLLSGYERGRLDTLIQVGVLIEGWNSPRCKLLLDLAPSISRVRATQKYFRAMTRFGEQEARIYVILPKCLPMQPILPVDLLIKPGEGYLCGDLLSPATSRDTRQKLQLDSHGQTPIKGVKIKKRILACASLRKPDLDPTDPSQVQEVLRSCRELDPSSPCGRNGFQRLLFQHPLFTGSGATLLRYLGVANKRGAYWSYMAELLPEGVGRRILEEKGGLEREIRRSCLDDLRDLARLALKANRNGGRPTEPFRSAFRALCGTMEEPPIPEDLLLSREQINQILKCLRELNEREQYALGRRFGLFGESELTYEEIAQRLGVSRERVRQIESKALRRLRARVMRARSGFLPAARKKAGSLASAEGKTTKQVVRNRPEEYVRRRVLRSLKP